MNEKILSYCIISTLIIMVFLNTITAYGNDSTYDSQVVISSNSDLSSNSIISNPSATGDIHDPYIIENHVFNTSDQHCLKIANTDKYLLIRNCTFANLNNGQGSSEIYIHNSSNITIDVVSCDMGVNGIIIEESTNILILNSFINNSTENGILVEDSNQIILNNNSLRKNSDSNINISNILNSEISKNVLANSSGNGIYIHNVYELSIIDNIIHNNSNGINVYRSKWIGINNNSFLDNYRGIYSFSSTCNNISNNRIYNSTYHHIYADFLSDSIIFNNIMNQSQYGIYFFNSNHNNISYNRITTEIIAINMVYSWNNYFSENKLINSGIRLSTLNQSHYSSNKFDSKNSVNNHPLLILLNQNNLELLSRYGQILIFDSNNIKINNQNIDHATLGVYCYNSNNISLYNSHISNNSFNGIYMKNSEGYILIENSTFNNNDYDIYSIGSNNLYDIKIINSSFSKSSSAGFFIGSSNVAKLENCRIYNSNLLMGRLLGVNYAIITNNTLKSSNHFGLQIDGKGCIVENNLITDCTYWALYVDVTEYESRILNNSFINNERVIIRNDFARIIASYNLFKNNQKGLDCYSTNAEIYSNNFIHNAIQASDREGSNNWYKNSIGNYWSDYSQKYPSASNNDIYWNTPYSIEGDGNSNDPYPRVYPFDPIYPIIEDHSQTIGYTGDLFLFNFNISDNLGINRAFIDYRTDKNPVITDSLNNIQGDIWNYEMTISNESVNPINYSVRIMDEGGNWVTTDWKYISVEDNDPPIISSISDLIGELGALIRFDNVDYKDNIGINNVSWEFNYGRDHVILYGDEPSFMFETIGEYVISLIIKDESELTTEISFNLTIIDTIDPVIEDMNDLSFPVGTFVSLTIPTSDIGGIANYSWTITNLSDMIFNIYEPTFNYTFNRIGGYQISYYVEDASGNSAVTHFNIEVFDDIDPTIVTELLYEVDDSAIIIFDGSSSYDNYDTNLELNYSWVFDYNGMNTNLYGMSPAFEFVIPGFYTISLVVRDTSGNSNSTNINVIVYDTTLPTIILTGKTTINETEELYLSLLNSYDNSEIIEYIWYLELDEDIVVNGPQFSYSLLKFGIYSLRIIVIDAWNNTAHMNTSIQVSDITPPIARLGDDITIEVNNDVILDGSASTDNNQIKQWFWYFKYDNTDIILSGEIVNYTFHKPGRYEITLEVLDQSNNSHTEKIVIFVEKSQTTNGNHATSYILPIIVSVCLIAIILIFLLIFIIKKSRNLSSEENREGSDENIQTNENYPQYSSYEHLNDKSFGVNDISPQTNQYPSEGNYAPGDNSASEIIEDQSYPHYIPTFQEPNLDAIDINELSHEMPYEE